MNEIDVSKFPALVNLLPKIQQEHKVIKQKEKIKLEKTKEGDLIVQMMGKLFDGASNYFYITLMDVNNKSTANSYVNSLTKRKKHKMLRKYLEILQMIMDRDEEGLEKIRQRIYYGRLSAKLDKNRGLKKSFLSGKLSVKEVENLFDVNNKKS